MAFNSDNVEVFLCVLDSGSFSAAARQLRRVPSAVSMTIANLEAELDLLLFDRSGREPRPTAAALTLEPQARLLVTQLKALQAHALGLTQGLESRLTLAIAPELVSASWSAPLAQLAREYPLLEVEVLAAPQADALDMLHRGRAQLALVFERPSIDGREGFQEVGSEILVAVIAPEHPVLLAAGGRFSEQHLSSTRQIVVAGRDQTTIDPRLAFSRHAWRTDNAPAALALIMEGLGWGWLPRNFAKPHVSSGTLLEIPLENLSNGIALCVDMVWSRERPTGLAAKRFIALMKAARNSSAKSPPPKARR